MRLLVALSLVTTLAPLGPAGRPHGGFSQPPEQRRGGAVRAAAIPGITTEFRVVSLECRSDQWGR